MFFTLKRPTLYAMVMVESQMLFPVYCFVYELTTLQGTWRSMYSTDAKSWKSA